MKILGLLNGYALLVLCLLMVSNGGFASDKLLIVNGNINEDCVLQGLSSISSTGDLNVSVADFEACMGDSVPGLAVSQLLVSDTSVLPNDTLEMLWVSAGAFSCSPQGNLPGWTSQFTGLAGPLTFSVPGSAQPGQYSAAIQCSDGENVVLSPSVTVQIEQAQVNPPAAPTLSVSPSTVQQGQSVQITWSSSNATGCSVPTAGSGDLPGWSGNKSTAGNQTIQISEAVGSGNYTVRLRCQNAGGNSPITSRTVTVQEASPSSCGPNQQPPNGMARATVCTQSGGGDCRSYADFFGGFPGTTSIRFFVLQPNTYAAMAFTPNSVPAAARAQLNVEPLQTGGIGPGGLIWSISNCPGDFNKNAVIDVMGDPACFLSGVFANFGFNFGGSDSSTVSTRCALTLDPGTTYYLNILYSNDDPNTTPGSDLTWSCGADSTVPCGHQIQPISLFGWN